MSEPHPTTKQYMAKYISLPRFTMFIMNLHAKQPDKNAAIKPKSNGNVSMFVNALLSFSIFNKSKKASPNIGIITIKKEN